MQCAATAMTAGAAATGLRAVAASKQPRWLTPPRLKALTGGLLFVAVAAAGIGVG